MRPPHSISIPSFVHFVLERARAIVLLIVAVTVMQPSNADAGWEYLRWAEILRSSHLSSIAVAPDRANGMLVAAIDHGMTPRRVVVTRIDHNGTEIWGNGGIYLPFTIGTIETSPPLDVCPGQNGAAYVAFIEERETLDMLRLARIESDGSHAWTVDVDNLYGGIPLDGRDVKMFGTIPGEDVIVTWLRETTGQFYAARFNADGSRPWHGPINDQWRPGMRWEVFTDAQGGLLVVFSRSYGSEPSPHYVNVQRLAGTTGARMWGSDGLYLWLTDDWGADNDIVHDGHGGAWVLRSDFGTVYAQRVDAVGNIVWPSDLLVLDTPYSSHSYSEMRPDGDGGFFLTHGREELFVQRVNLDGTLPWGSGGRSIATAMIDMSAVSLYGDGLGGVVIGYYNLFDVSDPMWPCVEVHVARVDAFGSLLWDRLIGRCTEDWSTNLDIILDNPRLERTVGDGSGGAITAFSIHDIAGGARPSVIGYGLDQNGEAPTPRLTQLIPDSARPGQATEFLIYGNYLDLSLDYELVHEHGVTSLMLAPTEMHGYQLVEGFTTLPDLTPGTYHLVVDSYLAPPDTLHFALGVGSPPTCDADEPIVETENYVSVEGSQRQSAIDSNGTISITWVQRDAVTSNYALMVQRVLGPGSPTAVYVSRKLLRHPTLAVDAFNRIHMAVVREDSPTSHTVVRLKLDEGLGIEEMDEWGGVWEHYRPVIAITGESTVHLVFETRGTTDPYSGSRIEHVMVEGTNSHHTSFVRDWLPREPDVVAIGNHLLMVYVEDHSGPWYAMLMSQLCRPGFPPDWQEPEVLDTADQVTSPSVAWDGAGRLLFAWISDNSAATGEPAKVLSLDWENQTFGEVRARPGQAQHHAVSVSSTGPGKFAMLTLESEGGPDMGVWLRQGDGRCFFPRVQLNTTGRDVTTPLLAASPISGERLVHWQDYEMISSPIRGAYCAGIATGVPEGQAPVGISRQLWCKPNPSNPSATLFFDLWEAGRARLIIYDARGRLVRTLLDAELVARDHEIVWDGRDDRGVQLSSGVYFVRLIRPGGFSSITKVSLIK